MLRGLDTVEEFWAPRQVVLAKERAHDGSLAAFRTVLGSFLGVPIDSVHLAPSGGKSLEWLLRCRKDSRKRVMLPAFNCSVVFDAVVSAGYEVKLYDFYPAPGVFNWKRVLKEISPDVSVLIVTHYFGVPVDFREVLEFCRANGIVVIEDCAHTLGAKIEGYVAGTLGDAAIFSFNYDKPISLGWGGFCLVNNKIPFDLQVPNEWRIPNLNEELLMLNQFMGAMESRRNIIRYHNNFFFRMLRRAKLVRVCEFKKDISISVGAIQAEIGLWCLARYAEVIAQRNSNASKLSSDVCLTSWPVGANISPAWIKQKIRIDGSDLNVVSLSLQSQGIRVGNFNWPVFPGLVKAMSDCPNAHDAACNWVDVPVHQNMNTDAFYAIVNRMNRTNSQKPSAHS